jgi:membrane protein DedA with SNARE-associated domain
MTFEMLIARFGLLALFVGAGVEGETVAMIGGLLAHQHFFPLPGAMIAVAAGSFVADQIFFAIGRRFRDHPRVRRIAARPGFAKAVAAFERHPRRFILVFRFIYGLRTVSPIAVGTTDIPARIFIPLNAVAAIVWGVLFTGIGYVFSQGIEQFFGKLRSAEHMLIAGAGVALLLFGIVRLLSFAKSN